MPPIEAADSTGQPFSAANFADACVAFGESMTVVTSLRPSAPLAATLAGPVIPVRHYGSVDVFLEAIGNAAPGDIMVVDNQGRDDEGCIGDLVAIEAAAAGIAAILIWGRHRDTAEIAEIGIPLLSLGPCPAGPLAARPRPDPEPPVRCDHAEIRRGQAAVADVDGIVFVDSANFERLTDEAVRIRAVEAAQSAEVRRGRSIREQLDFDRFLAERGRDPAHSFRDHLRQRGGAIET